MCDSNLIAKRWGAEIEKEDVAEDIHYFVLKRHSFGMEVIMNTKMMEGLVGAGVNMKIRDTPMRVYKEAEREGDIGKMEQAMGYVNKFSERAWEYKSETEEGLEEEAREAREKEKLEQEEAVTKRREEQKEQAERSEKTEGKDTDTVEVSEEGRELLKEKMDSGQTGSVQVKRDHEPVIYTKEGKKVSILGS